MRAPFLLAAGFAWAAVTWGAALAGTVTTFYKFGQWADRTCEPTLAAVAGGLLYGTSLLGGTKDYGLLFSLDPKTGTLRHLHDFSGGADGQNPDGVVLFNGLLYGAAQQTPMPAHGEVYSIDPAGGAFTVIHTFFPYQKGDFPNGNLIAAGGLLYGAAAFGGVPDHGGVFSVDPTSGKEAFTPLHGARGRSLFGPLLQVGKLLYGAAYYRGGGGADAGTIFAFDPDARRMSKVHGFGSGADGTTPDSPLIQVGNAVFGTTAYGPGSTNGGVVFKIDLATGTESVVFRFTKLAEGQLPGGYLVLVNGLIYGTTNNGGSRNAGTIHTIDPVSGAHSVVYNFTGGASDYGAPLYGLLYQDGVFYGTTGSFGTEDQCGTAFSYVP